MSKGSPIPWPYQVKSKLIFRFDNFISENSYRIEAIRVFSFGNIEGHCYVKMSDPEKNRKQMSAIAIAETPDGIHKFGNIRPAIGTDIPLDEKSDDVLITLFQAGEERAFKVLVERYQERIRNVIYSVLRDPEVIDDLAQDIFIKVYEALPRFRFESSLYTWLYRITINKTRDEIRKKRVRRVISFESLEKKAEREISERLRVEPYDFEPKEIVSAGLRALPEKFRMPIILKDIDGRSYEEIAEILECRIGTVKSRLSRGRTMLRDVLRPLLEENYNE